MTDEFAPAAQIGLIALATDHAVESEMRRFLPSNAALYTTRVPAPDNYGLETLRATEAELARGAALLVPGSPLDVIAYGCTSATAAIGEAQVFAEIRKARPGIACTTPMTAADAALKALGARSVVLVTPYEEPVHATVARAIEARGFTIVDQAFLGIGKDSAITEVTQSHLGATVTARRHDKADAIFIACTSLRTSGLIGRLEAALDRPVVASDQAMAWHALQLAGHREPTLEGRIFQL